MVLGYFLITNYNYVFGTYIYINIILIINLSEKNFRWRIPTTWWKKELTVGKSERLDLGITIFNKGFPFSMKFSIEKYVELILLCYRNKLNVFSNWFFEFFDLLGITLWIFSVRCCNR